MTLREKLFATAPEYSQLTDETVSALSNKLFDDRKSLDRIGWRRLPYGTSALKGNRVLSRLKRELNWDQNTVV